MRITGPAPGSFGPEPAPKPISGKEKDFAASLKTTHAHFISAIIDKLDKSVTLETQKFGPEEFKVFYRLDRNMIQEAVEQLAGLKNLELSKSLHVDEAIMHLKQLSNVADKSQSPDALEHINKAKKELDSL